MKKIKSGVNYLLIILFTLLGIIGLALPFVPQAIFFAIALIILSIEFPIIEAYFDQKISKNNYLGKMYHNLKDRIKKILK